MMKLRSQYLNYNHSLLQAGNFKGIMKAGTDVSQEMHLLVSDASSEEFHFWGHPFIFGFYH